MTILSKIDFTNLISEQNDLTKTDATKVIEFFTKAVETVIANGDQLNLIGFGSFYILENSAREGKNPKTGEKIQIPASKSAKFRAGSNLKKACNK